MHAKQSINIPKHLDGQRLDNVIILIFPELSLRARRRIWEDWHIYVNDTPKGPGFRVKCGQTISLQAKIPPALSIPPNSVTYSSDQPYLIKNLEDLCFIYKPRGLHSTYLTKGGPSLEDKLNAIMGQAGTLCNRLDAQTSGIVVAAKTELALNSWQDIENMGQCQKHYIALVQGNAHNCCINNALDTDKRKKSRVLQQQAPTLRHTHFKVLAQINEIDYAVIQQYFQEFPKIMPQNLYLMACTIYKGARHQIRAHAAYAGFPLFNDLRYISNLYTNECFLLHHNSLKFIHNEITCQAPWEDKLTLDTSQHIKNII